MPRICQQLRKLILKQDQIFFCKSLRFAQKLDEISLFLDFCNEGKNINFSQFFSNLPKLGFANETLFAIIQVLEENFKVWINEPDFELGKTLAQVWDFLKLPKNELGSTQEHKATVSELDLKCLIL